MNEIRIMLCEEIENLRQHKTAAKDLNALVNATNSVLRTVKLEMEYAKLSNKAMDTKFIELTQGEVAKTPASQ